MTLAVDGLSHRYGDERAVSNVSFAAESGELLGVLGPSGCGKTTIVQAVAGHVRPTAGRVRLRGVDVTDDSPESRAVGLVFQRSTVFPHQTVGENVEYGLAARDVGRRAREERVAEYLELVDLAGERGAYPAALSGGQRRRAELARALAPRPDVLLLDEPLSALDRPLAEQLREEIARIHRETGVTTLFVTHDQDHAMALADRLVVMADGEVASVGTPRALYESPPTPFVASFLGRSNALPAPVVESRPLTVALGGATLALPHSDGDFPAGSTVTCHVRPEELSLEPDDGTDGSVPGEVTGVRDVGRRYDVTVQVGSGEELLVEHVGAPPATGDAVAVAVPTGKLTVFEEAAGDPRGPR